MGDFTLDFYCATASLCVEVDGDQHEIHTARDAERDAGLAAEGILTLRFSSAECFSNADGVAQVIERVCKERTDQPRD